MSYPSSVVATLFACLATACTAAPADDAQETSDIEMHIDGELNQQIAATTDLTQLRTFLCRKGDFGAGIFSLRSFNGHLCQDTYVSGLKLVGGAAMLICWNDNLDDFQGSHCAENALEEFGLSTYDEAAITSQMSTIVNGYEASTGASANAYYAGAKTLFCLIPKSLLGPGGAVHDIWCGP